MRRLMFFTIGFTIATAAGAYLLSGMQLLILSFICIAAAIVFCFIKKNANVLRPIAVVVLGCAIGALWVLGYHALYIAPAKEYNGMTVEASVTVTEYTEETSYGAVTQGRIRLSGQSYKLRLYTDGDTMFHPGDIVNGTFTLRCTAEGERDSDSYLIGNGIYFVASTESIENIDTTDRNALSHLPARLRLQITSIIDRVFPSDTVGFAKALLLGDSSGLDYELDTDFKLSGIRHIIAVSGLHVSILFSLVYLLAGKRKLLTALLGVPVLLLFAAVAGFTPSIVRACVMQLLMIVAVLLEREYDPPTALSFAVLLMLAVNPAAVTSVSLQLSVGCMAGIFLFSKSIQDYLLHEKRLGTGKGNSVRAIIARWLASGISVSLSATVFTAPLSAIYFGTFSILAVVTNLLTLWAVSIIFYGIMVSCLLALFWSAGANVIAWLISWLMRFVCTVSSAVASVPVAAVYTCSVYIVFWLIFSYVLLAVFFLSKKKRPAVFTVCIVASLIISIAASWIEPRLDNYRITVLDVGQGQSILLQCDGKSYLVDCGGKSDTGAADAAAEQLLSQGITALDGIIVTHYDTDHAGGVANLLTRIQAKTLYLPASDNTTALDEAIVEKASNTVCYVTETQLIREGKVSLTIYAPNEQTSRNESSLCVLFQGETCDILITGDRGVSGERALLAQAQLPKVDVLIVGHHGAEDSTGLELLHTVRPEIAVISVGKDNAYGHPSQAVLQRLEAFRCRIYRTDTDGSVIIRG